MPASVRLDRALRETVVQQRQVTGEATTLLRARIAAQVDGLITELDLNEGDAVSRGDVIALLDPERARLLAEQRRGDVEQQRGLVRQRGAELERAARDLERIELLFEREGTGESEIDRVRTERLTADAALAEARGELIAAEASLDAARRDLRDMTIVAPFSGRVVEKLAEVGEWVMPGSALVELVSLERVEARIDVPEQLLPFLLEGIESTRRESGGAADRLNGGAGSPDGLSIGTAPPDPSRGDPDAPRDPAPRPVASAGLIPLAIPGVGRDITDPVLGRFEAVVPAANPVSRIFTVRVSLPGEIGQDNRAVLPGMSLSALVPTGDPLEAVTVHRDAILRDAAGELIYIATESPSGTRSGRGSAPDSGAERGDTAGEGAARPGPSYQASPLRVRTRFAVGDRVVLEPGPVQPGMLVLVDGNERVFPTQPLIVLNERVLGERTDNADESTRAPTDAATGGDTDG